MPRCGFVLSKRFLCTSTGKVGTDAHLERELCPNDDTLMVQHTEADVIAAYERAFERGLAAYGTLQLVFELQRGRGGSSRDTPDLAPVQKEEP